MSAFLPLDDSVFARARLEPLIHGSLMAWEGLLPFSIETIRAALGEPDKVEQAFLGSYPASYYRFSLEAPSGGLGVFVRGERAVMVEMLIPPPLAAMKELEEPCTIKPHEILAGDSYVHEYVYCERGLVLSIAEPFDKQQTSRIVRCRGIQPLSSPSEFGPELYMPFEDRISFR